MTKETIIKKYLGVPFKNHGRDPKDGLDCYGLMVAVYADLGIRLYDISETYDSKWSFKKKNLLLENYWREWQECTDPRFLDVICFDNREGVGYHLGLVLDAQTFLHTSKAGTVVSRTRDWKGKIRGFYRYRYGVKHD